MPRSIHVFFLILVLHVLEYALANKFSSFSHSHADECSLLFQFKESMSINKSASVDSRAYPKVASWNLNNSYGAGNCCLWDGVECRFGHVIGLDLSSSFLYGTISSNNSLFDLIHLRTLNLADNDFDSSQIPSGIGRLSQLANLDLSYSVFSGEVPKQISQLRNLVSLDLSSTYGLKMQSSDLQNLVQNSSETLRELFLFSVNIDSELPASIGNLTHLNTLDLGFCGFTGTLPASVSNLTQLTFLDLSGNEFTGRLPSLESLSNLTFLSLFGNKFDRWKLPDWFGKLNKITHLSLSDVNLYGEIPSSFFNLTQVERLDLSSNQLEGELSLSQNLLMGFEQHSPVASWVNLRSLDLSHNMLHGSIPVPPPTTELFSVSNNMLTGEIPPSICDLMSLQSLDLSFNNITGSIPPCLKKLSNSLAVLNLRRNTFQGTIPNIFTNESKYQMINLSENKLQGQVPRSLENCESLQILNLGHNLIEDMFPFWLGALSELQVLILRSNKFHGTITISSKIKVNFSKLHILDLSYNSFHGDLPHQYFLEWPAMKETNMATYIEDDHILKTYWFSIHMPNKGEKMDYRKTWNIISSVDLSSNMFRGKIPESITSLSSLQLLNLSNNELSGVIPPSMGNLIRLVALDISGNKLSGMIPQDLVQLNFLAIFLVSNNRLTGEIPPSICELLSLQWLDLSFNNITGLIPPCLKKLSNSLVVLNLRRNTFQGTIPNIFTNESKYQMIDLSENKLQGQVPRSLENCVELQILNLGDNLIEDMFPFWLGSLSELQILILRLNKFHGTITIPSKMKFNFPNLHIIDLSYNAFCGYLPHQYFQEWSAMKEPRANELLGGYRFSIQMTNKGVKMEYVKNIKFFSAVDFSCNMFRGKIPESITTLGGLQSLNLSNNAIDGVIPQYMGNLTHLESLDLSSNKLSGKIPQELVQLNFLGVLNLSNNKLIGPIPQGRHFDTFSNNSFKGNKALCGYPLSMKCGDSKASKPPKVPFEKDTESDFPNGVDWVVILIGVVTGLVIGLVCEDHLTTRYYKWFL